jgi:hypothetical protein
MIRWPAWHTIRPPAVVSSVDGSGSPALATTRNHMYRPIAHPIPSHLFPLVLFLDPRQVAVNNGPAGVVSWIDQGHQSSGRASASWDRPRTASLLDHAWSTDPRQCWIVAMHSSSMQCPAARTGDQLEALVRAVRPQLPIDLLYRFELTHTHTQGRFYVFKGPRTNLIMDSYDYIYV